MPRASRGPAIEPKHLWIKSNVLLFNYYFLMSVGGNFQTGYIVIGFCEVNLLLCNLFLKSFLRRFEDGTASKGLHNPGTQRPSESTGWRKSIRIWQSSARPRAKAIIWLKTTSKKGDLKIWLFNYRSKLYTRIKVYFSYKERQFWDHLRKKNILHIRP